VRNKTVFFLNDSPVRGGGPQKKKTGPSVPGGGFFLGPLPLQNGPLTGSFGNTKRGRGPGTPYPPPLGIQAGGLWVCWAGRKDFRGREITSGGNKGEKNPRRTTPIAKRNNRTPKPPTGSDPSSATTFQRGGTSSIPRPVVHPGPGGPSRRNLAGEGARGKCRADGPPRPRIGHPRPPKAAGDGLRPRLWGCRAGLKKTAARGTRPSIGDPKKRGNRPPKGPDHPLLVRGHVLLGHPALGPSGSPLRRGEEGRSRGWSKKKLFGTQD